MKITYLSFCFYGLIMILCLSCNKSSVITMETLLQEMTDREQLAQFPEPEYTCRQFSSYDRNAVQPGDYTWFANRDNNYFLRTEYNHGRREYVLFDAEGPGAVVRFWSTFSRYDKKGFMRFYFDGESEPRLEGEPMDILSGAKLVPEPLSFSVSPATDYFMRGHNLYLPIPYAKHLKITYETETIRQPRDRVHEVTDKTQQLYYYQIDYRTYKPGVKVTSFKMKNLVSYSTVIDETINKLTACDRGLTGMELSTDNFSGVLSPRSQKVISFKGTQAIRKIQVRIQAADLGQALRSTVMAIKFDGKQTVWGPIGDFFGTGYKIAPVSTWYQEVRADSVLEVYWVMPFKNECVVSFTNYGKQDVEILDGRVITSPWKWNERSMYFGSSWYQNTRINTGLTRKGDGHGDMFDINYTTLKGEGIYVGDAVTLFNCSPEWWGEGDEKIFIDDESFPSHFGTGTEDYYGYGWGRPETYAFPFIAQPDGSGNLSVGYTVDMRYRVLDAIPFTKNLKFDMELWHSDNTVMNHAPVTYWYLKPGGACTIVPDTAGVMEPIVLRSEQILPPVTK